MVVVFSAGGVLASRTLAVSSVRQPRISVDTVARIDTSVLCRLHTEPGLPRHGKPILSFLRRYSKFDLDFYSDGKIFKNHEDFLCHLSYAFELPVKNYGTTYYMVIAEEPSVLLPPPEPPPLTFVSLTTITTKWGENYQEWEESNSTHCRRIFS